MTVETTIQWMVDSFPDLFTTRKECYNHLFCVIGNGYEWKRGQIVRRDEEDNIEAEERDYAVWRNTLLIDRKSARQTDENIQKREEWRKLLVSGGVLESKLKDKWYPLCEYSLIKNVPEDVKPDWAKAVEECKQMLKEDGIEV